MPSIDKYPQLMTIQLSGSGVSVGSYTQISVETPVQLLSIKRLLAMNVLKAWFSINLPAGDFDDNDIQRWQLTKAEQSALLSEDHPDNIIPQIAIETKLEATGGLSDAFVPHPFVSMDFNNGKGDGLLITDKTVHLGTTASGAPGTATGTLYLLYNLVEVSAEELLQEAFLVS